MQNSGPSQIHRIKLPHKQDDQGAGGSFLRLKERCPFM